MLSQLVFGWNECVKDISKNFYCSTFVKYGVIIDQSEY